MTECRYDVVVWGATGFTGALVAEYLLASYGVNDSLRWAIAGRDERKLSALKRQLGERAAQLDTLTADSFDDARLDALAGCTRVVITTVGPYARYGSALVEACVRHGTDYCDLAGEAQWIREMIDTHQQAAEQSGARIVHCCGFDSVPMDIGAWFLQQEAQQRFGGYCESITMLVKATSGTASGGTIASMLNILEQVRRDRSVAKILVHPYALNPPDQRSGPDGRDQQGLQFDQDAKVWTAPFVMAGINTKVVRRSHALLGLPWGRQFRYREAVMTGKGVSGWLKAWRMTLALGGFMLLASVGPTRRLLARFVLPKPGEGPDAAARERGFFNLRQFGTLPGGDTIRSRITGDRDPGYGSTSKMLGECAVCLALDDPDTPGGIHTPASAMAAPLIERLRNNAGLTFDVVDGQARHAALERN